MIEQLRCHCVHNWGFENLNVHHDGTVAGCFISRKLAKLRGQSTEYSPLNSSNSSNYPINCPAAKKNRGQSSSALPRLFLFYRGQIIFTSNAAPPPRIQFNNRMRSSWKFMYVAKRDRQSPHQKTNNNRASRYCLYEAFIFLSAPAPFLLPRLGWRIWPVSHQLSRLVWRGSHISTLSQTPSPAHPRHWYFLLLLLFQHPSKRR